MIYHLFFVILGMGGKMGLFNKIKNIFKKEIDEEEKEEKVVVTEEPSKVESQKEI